MNRYIIFASHHDYFRVAFDDVIGIPGVHYQPDFLYSTTRLKKILHSLHIFRGISKKITPPLREIWYKQYFPEECKEGTQYYFVFFFGWHRICGNGFLKFLRERFPGCKCILYLCDLNEAKKLDMEKMKKLFDHIMLFERNYAEQCGVEYFPLVYSEGLKDIPMKERDIDLLFVGKAKGRYDFLKRVYDRLTANGVHCEFYLSHIDQKVDQTQSGIHIVDHVPYEDNIRLLKRSKCVLDIVPPETNCNTLRMSEAMYYNNRVITNNVHIVDEEYYSPELISLYTNPEDIDLDFLKKEYKDVNYPLKENISPNAFLRHLDEVFGL